MNDSIRMIRSAAALGLVLGAVAAHAASGYSVTRHQEALVAPGMSRSDVLAALGHPVSHMHFGNEPGPTYTYRIVADGDHVFDVDFDAAGKVLSTSERDLMRD